MTFTSDMFGNITLGSDPEILLTTKGGQPFGARDCSTGTKEKPEPLKFGALQVDGMALEYNIDPASTLQAWNHNHKAVLAVLEERANEQGLTLSDASLLDYSQYIDEESPTEDELLFGCDPDLNAYTGQENVMPDNDGSIKYRTAGGHVHVGFSNWSEQDDPEYIAQCLTTVMDMTLGCWSVLEDNGLERKKLYGSAGAYRVKPYGFEYRTLSNFWVFNDAQMSYVFTTVTRIMSLPTDKLLKLVELGMGEMASVVHNAINKNDKGAAKSVLAIVESVIDA